MKWAIFLLALMALTPAFANIPENPEEIEPLPKGSRIPSVELRNLEGQTVDLKERVTGNPSVLIFYRGSWCPYCNRHLAALMEIEEALRSLGYELVAISPDKPEHLAEAIRKNNLDYTLLSDSKAEAAKAFGLAFRVGLATRTLYKGYGIDLEKASGEAHHILPVPAVYVVDGNGVIQYGYTNADYKVRLSPEKVLEAARQHAPES